MCTLECEAARLYKAPECGQRFHKPIRACRYMHYYQRWAENDKARAQARRLAQHAAEGQLHRLSELTATPTSQLKFISDAWDQVC